MKLLAPQRKYMVELLRVVYAELTRETAADAYVEQCSASADKRVIAILKKRKAAKAKKAAMVQKLILKIETPS